MRDDKKNNELHLNDLNEKYALRKKKLIDQYNAAKNEVDARDNERNSIKKDFDVL